MLYRSINIGKIRDCSCFGLLCLQSLGLATEYLQHGGTYTLCRKLLCLPYLPAEHVEEVFDAMEDVNCAPHIQPVFDYMRSTWLESDLWTVECWSVFGQTHRTNNDLEGKTYSKQYNKTILKSMCKFYLNRSSIIVLNI